MDIGAPADGQAPGGQTGVVVIDPQQGLDEGVILGHAVGRHQAGVGHLRPQGRNRIRQAGEQLLLFCAQGEAAVKLGGEARLI